jgi:hypothetical protein
MTVDAIDWAIKYGGAFFDGFSLGHSIDGTQIINRFRERRVSRIYACLSRSNKRPRFVHSATGVVRFLHHRYGLNSFHCPGTALLLALAVYPHGVISMKRKVLHRAQRLKGIITVIFRQRFAVLNGVNDSV